jgi:hypothetical protein
MAVLFSAVYRHISRRKILYNEPAGPILLF